MNISIVTSFYNHYDRFLVQWAKSIVELNTPPSETVIIVSGQDFNQDNIDEADRVLKTHFIKNTIVYIPNHLGMGYARNEAVKSASSEWILYLDVDDIILPEAIDIYSKYKDITDVICGGIRIQGALGNRDVLFLDASNEKAKLGGWVSSSHGVYKKRLWEKSPYITKNDFVDQPLWLGFSQIGARFIGTNEVCTVYLSREDGHNKSMTPEDKINAKNQFKFFVEHGVSDRDTLNMFWCKTDMKNFGDELAPIVFSWISDKDLLYVSPKTQGKILTIGSIMEKWQEGDVIWGTGTMYDREIIAPKGVKILAVRGPLSREKIVGVHVPEVYGDPALLMPKIYSPKPYKKHKIGIIPHYVDHGRFVLDSINDSDILFIDVRKDYRLIIDQINSCDVIISSSLHGIIVSEAYGKPVVWCKLSDKILGGNHKFNDYFLSTGRTEQQPVVLMMPAISGKMIRAISVKTLPTPTINTEPLIKAWNDYFKSRE